MKTSSTFATGPASASAEMDGTPGAHDASGSRRVESI